MKKIIVLLLCITSVTVFSNEYLIDDKLSSVSWHLYIKKGTNVYGDLKLNKDIINIGESQNTGELHFLLNNTKSYEMDEGKKEWSSSRDDRIYKITSASKTPTFKITNITGIKSESASHTVEIKGELSLNGVSKNITINGVIVFRDNHFDFNGKYKLNWQDFKIDNPIMWFMRVTKTADPFISLNFKISANKK